MNWDEVLTIELLVDIFKDHNLKADLAKNLFVLVWVV